MRKPRWSWGLGERMAWMWAFPIIGLVVFSLGLAVLAYQAKFGTLFQSREVPSWALPPEPQRPLRCRFVADPVTDKNHVPTISRVCTRERSIAERVLAPMQPGTPAHGRLVRWAERWMAPFLFLRIGGLQVIPRLQRHRNAARVRETGQSVQAKVSEIVRDDSIRVMNASPWHIHAQWQDPLTRKLHLFRSDPIWFEPSEFVGETVRVVLDPAEPKHYWMDTEFLPELA